ncbi:hypothetical protein CLV40_102466 [Actinokineospora auranticolor]|uniref:Uncharacterized protein n=1 Tax=Actinokineospora auranticolor TaxID=155976 RepID=A0A2S6GZF9_9PSEU|nr:hypothetical protein CLV40_102466 [Actinokineospora auranticolor]
MGVVNIGERLKEAGDRAVPGFWEGDLVLGSACESQILTLVERLTRFVMLFRVPHDRSADRIASSTVALDRPWIGYKPVEKLNELLVKHGGATTS